MGHLTPHTEAVENILKKAEENTTPLDEASVHTLTDQDLDTLATAVLRSKIMSLQRKERLSFLITEQRNRLKLRQNLPQRPDQQNATPLQKTEMLSPEQNTQAPLKTASEKEEAPQTMSGIVTRFSVGVTDTVLPSSWTKEWSTTKKALVGAGITVGATVIIGSLVSAWFRGKNAMATGLTAGSQAEGGFLKKLLIGLGIGGAALIGLDMLNKKLKNPLGLPDNLLPGLPQETASAATNIATGAGNQLLNTGEEAMKVGGENVNFLMNVASKENISDALMYALANGGSLAYENGAFLLHIGTQAIALPAAVTGKILNWIRTGQRDEDLFMLYGASGAAYFVGQKTFNLLMRGQAKTLIPLTKKDLMFTALKIASGPLAPLNDAASILSRAATQQGREALKLRYIKQSLPGQVTWGIANSSELAWKGGLATNDGVLAAVKQWKVLQRDRDIMKTFSKNTLRMFSDAEVASAIGAEHIMADDIRLALNKLPIDANTPDIIRELKDVAHMGTEGFTGKMDEIWKGMMQSDANTSPDAAAGKGANSLDDAVPAQSGAAGGEAKKTASTVDTAAESAKIKKVDELLETKGMAKAFEEAGEAGKQAKIRMRIQLETASDEALDILKSKPGQKLLQGAIQSSDEIEHLVIAAKKTQDCLRSLKWCAVGVVADAIGPLLAYYSILDNNEKIRQTTNPEIKKVYEHSNFIYKIEGGVQSVIGISMAGLGVYSYVTGGTLMIGALPAAAYLGPIGLGVAIGSTIASHEVAELKRLELRYAQSERDLVRMSPGQILQYIEESKGLEDTKLLTAMLNTVYQEADFQNAETYTRAQGYRAYFAQIGMMTLQETSILDIDTETMKALEKMGKPHIDQHLKNMQAQRINDFVRDAEQYIAYKTQNSFTVVDAATLKQAQTYAITQYEKRITGAATPSVAWNNESYWGKAEQIAQKKESERYKGTRNALVEMSNDPSIFADNLPYFTLQLLHDDLALCEQNILKASYSGSWFGVENERTAARGNYAQQLRIILENTIHHVQTSKQKITHREMDTVILAMKDILYKNPSDMAKDVEEHHAAEKNIYTEIGSAPGRLTEVGILNLLKTAT